MAYTPGNLALISSVNGFGLYRYDTTDEQVTVEAAGYLNNLDDTLNLAKGDVIQVWTWVTAVRTGTIGKVGVFAVTNVIANDAAASAGNVNIAEIGISSAGALSSLA
jgi:hypothetical protein